MTNLSYLPDDQKEFLDKKISDTFRTYDQEHLFLSDLYNRTVQDVVIQPERNFFNIGAVKEHIARTIACKLGINSDHEALNTILDKIPLSDYRKPIEDLSKKLNLEARRFMAFAGFLNIDLRQSITPGKNSTPIFSPETNLTSAGITSALRVISLNELD